MDEITAKKISRKVQLDYNRIAMEFSNKRRGLTPDILEFEKYISKHNRVLDFGCGNGRAFELVSRSGADYIGVDNSSDLIEQAKNIYPDAKFKFMENLDDFPDNSFDIILSLAVVHHIPSKDLRAKLLSDLRRVLKPGGKLILTAWDLWSVKDNYKPLIGGDENDILYDFKNSTGKVLAQRYIHVFSEEELNDLITDAGFKIIDSYQNSRGNKKVHHNLVVIGKK